MSRIADILGAGPTTLSYEFSPPKAKAQAEALDKTIGELAITEPDFISVTCGALGSNLGNTSEITIAQNARRDFPAMAHFICAGQSVSKVVKLVETYNENGVENILALRGDAAGPDDDFGHAIDLVELIKDLSDNTSVGVAAHPEVHPDSTSRKKDREHLAAKLEAADFAITQFFFDADDYARLIEELDELGCRKPVLPGVMLFVSADGLERMADLNDARIPERLRKQLETLTTSDDIAKLAVETAAQLAEDLRNQGAPGLHVYTMNRSQPAIELVRQLG